MNMLYGVKDRPKTIRELIIYAIQQVLAIFVATVLIANICGTPIDACLLGACIATLIYQVITKFSSPMFISSCGATCSAVLGALAISQTNNYLLVAIGGLTIFIIYTVFAILVAKRGIETINKIFPPVIVGSVTIVIGLNLATFIPTYCATGNSIGVLIALFVMLVIAVSSHYFKGFWKTIPFLIGLGAGYVLSIILTLTGVSPLIDFTIFKNIHLLTIPDFTFKYWDWNIGINEIGQVLILFVPVAICALLEHYSDHKVLSNIVGVDLTKNPGLHRTLLGDGTASLIGTIICGLPNTSYGESIATIGFSKVASISVITTAAIFTGCLSFLNPIQIFIQSIPACVFGGCAIILYGYIAASGLKTLYNSHLNLENNKTLIIISAILTIGVSGCFLFHESFAGVSLAMVVGVILNLILKDK